MSNPLNFDELQQTFDGAIPRRMIDMADGMGANVKQREQARAQVRARRAEVRRAFKTLRMVHAAPFYKRGHTTDQVMDWQARSLINAREAWSHYRIAQFQLRQAEGRMVAR
jgi:DNA polymerase IIIc chi subunit